MLSKKYIYILIIILVLIVIGLISFLASKKQELKEQEEELLPKEEIGIPEEFKPGEVGEPIEIKELEEGEVIPEEKQFVTLPPVVYNTSGVIKEIKDDRIIVSGSGSNFSDQKPRDLTIRFTGSTITYVVSTRTSYRGLDGLKYLKRGLEISIEGAENIRGKTEFDASYTNVL